MKSTETNIKGVFVIELEEKKDDRGFFARSYDEAEFESHGLPLHIVQTNISFNAKKGTLRGMHYQAAPHEELKLVRCTRGSIYDVVVDLRPESPTHKQWVSVELTSDNRLALYIPKGCAHGFQTLEDNSEIHYLMGEYFREGSARAVRYDDPAFAIQWPDIKERIISKKDSSYPDWT
jgi:dTDP-4-dehydrorhamnose 3,5-epimerase